MKTWITMLAVALMAGGLARAEVDWKTDYSKALAQAKAEKKLLLMDFTGSDWCGWCIKLNKEVFNTPEFEKYAKDNLVMLEVDFPQNKPISKEQKAANDKLAQKYGIQGFPTLIVLDGSGKQVGQLGYMPGGPKPMIAKLESLK